MEDKQKTYVTEESAARMTDEEVDRLPGTFDSEYLNGRKLEEVLFTMGASLETAGSTDNDTVYAVGKMKDGTVIRIEAKRGEAYVSPRDMVLDMKRELKNRLQKQALPVETQKQPLDVSAQVKAIFECTDFVKRAELEHSLKNTLRGVPSVSLTVDFTTVQDARWVKGWLEQAPMGQTRTASICATEGQMREEPNVFQSGVTWIKKE